MAKLGTATVFITGNLEGLNRALGDAERGIKRSAGNILAAGQKIGAGMTVAGGAIVAGLGLAVKAATEAENAQSQLNAVIKSTGGAAGMTAEELNKMAAELQKVTVFSDEAITSAQSILLTFTKIGEEVFPAATEAILDMSQALGQDLQSSAIQLGKALNDPVAGITALKRVGVSFTETQKEMIANMVESGNVMGAQKLILAELATEFGGSARAAAQTLTGQWAVLTNQGGELVEMIGTTLIPMLSQLMAQIMPHVQAAMKWVEANKELATQITLVVGALGLFGFTMGPILMALPSMVGLIAKLIGGGGALLGGGLAGFVGLGVALGALVGGAGLLVHFSDTVHTLINDRLPRLATLLDTVGGTLADIWGWLNKFPGVIASILPGLNLLVQGLKWLSGGQSGAAAGLHPLLSGGARGLTGGGGASNSTMGSFGARSAGGNTSLSVSINAQGPITEAMAMRAGEIMRRKIEDRRA